MSKSAKPADTSKNSNTPIGEPCGSKGLIAVYCPECGRSYTTAFVKPRASTTCRCGREISLLYRDMIRFRCRCDKCERPAYGLTNAQPGDPVDFKCRCGSDIRLEYFRKEDIFRGLGDS